MEENNQNLNQHVVNTLSAAGNASDQISDTPKKSITKIKILGIIVVILCTIIFAGFYFVSRNNPFIFGVKLPPDSQLLVTRHITTSTNTPEAIISVYKNGFVHVFVGGHLLVHKRDFYSQNVDISNLNSILMKIGDVSKTSMSTCVKAASFAYYTYITYQGKTSGDVTCAGELYADLNREFDNITLAVQSGKKYTAPNLNPDAKWATYSNSEFGFKINYPTGFKMAELENGNQIAFENLSYLTNPNLSEFRINVIKAPLNQSISQIISVFNDSKRSYMNLDTNSSTSLDGFPARRLEYSIKNMNQMIYTVIGVYNNNYSYILIFIHKPDDKLTNQIISSFKFKNSKITPSPTPTNIIGHKICNSDNDCASDEMCTIAAPGFRKPKNLLE